MKLNEDTKEWLLASEEPYVKYFVYEFLCPDHPDIKSLYKEFLADSFVRENIQIVKDWNMHEIQRHDQAVLHIHRLSMLCDLGLKASGNKEVQELSKVILDTFNKDNIPEINLNIPVRFGGTGHPQKSWCLCDYPTNLYSLLKMGVKNKKLDKSVDSLINLVDENGYRCKSSIPNFKGPGSKTSMCPYATLISAKVLAHHDAGRQSEAAKLAVEALLYHWQVQKEKKFFLFGIGTDFKKLKFPFVWYNLLHMTEVISHFDEFHSDKRFKEMIELLLSKSDTSLKFIPESIYMAYKTKEFSKKKEFSRIITLAAIKILNRVGKITFD